MKGFKSFAKRSELIFGDNFNCVIGPNGSGKSNILDALCFVLGRSSAKGLRSEKSANLIYNGGKLKNPAKEGEVSIYLDNSNKLFPCETPEVKVSRIVKHNGTGVYKINDKKCTKVEVQNMLAYGKITSEGFNIILQGDIVKFIDMKLEDRRKIIEEVAGINVYEEKRQKTLNELNKVEERLKEADIILKEREGYLTELKTERDQALKYNELKKNIDFNHGAYLFKKIEGRKSKVDLIEKNILKNQEEINKFNEKILEIETDVKNKKNNINLINKEIEDKGEKEQVQLQKQIENIKVELATNNSRINSIDKELKRVEERKSQLDEQNQEMKSKMDIAQNEIEGLKKKKNTIEKELDIIKKSILKFRDKNKLNDDLDSVYGQIDKHDEEEEILQKEINLLRTQQQEITRRKDKYEILIESLSEKYEKLAIAKKENAKQLKDLENKRDEFKKITQELNILLNNDSNFVAQIKNARDNVNVYSEKAAKLQAKQNSLVQNAAGDNAINYVLDMKSKNPQIHGMVSELGEVNEEYSLALEICAGGRIKDIIVEEDKVASNIISELKSKQIGACRFLPLNKIKSKPIEASQQIFAKKDGAIDFAINLVKFDNRFKNAMSHVFSNTLIVKNLDVARKIGIGKIRMVTLDGDLIEASGAMIGGYRKKLKHGSGGFAKKELNDEIKKVEKQFSDSSSVLSLLESKRHDNMDKIDRLRSFKSELDGDIKSLEKRLNIDSDELGEYDVQKETLTKQVDEMDTENDQVITKISQINSQMAKIKIEKTSLKNKVAATRSPKVLAELNTFEDKKKELEQDLIKVDTQIQSLNSQIKNIMNLEDSQTIKIIKSMEKEIIDFKEEKIKLVEVNKKFDDDLKLKEKQAEKFYLQFKELFQKRSELESNVNELNLKITQLNLKLKDFDNFKNNSNIEKAKFNAELMGLESEFEPFKDNDYSNVQKDESVLKSEITRWENEIVKIGNVNLRALEMYDIVEKEFNELLDKIKQLQEEKESVLLMLNEIETVKKEIFMKTFDKINHNFKEIFLNLNSKGEAFLELENEEMPFEGGLSVKVRLSGNKFLDIKSLSGGEKTMTTLAFIFAIQEYDPHSFYILDEIDAALDKHNSETLAKYVESYSKKAQYIVISHNDAVISDANYLYGISMNEHGMSTITTLKI